MKLIDSREIAAPPDAVWSALLDPDILMQSVPGCQELTGSVADGFEATVVQKVGPVKATFKGRVTLSDLQNPTSLTLSGEGKGGAAGFAKGGANVTLEPSKTGTKLGYEVEAKVGGKLAQLGNRIIDGFARKMADQFFANFQKAVENPDPPESGEADPANEGDPKKSGWFKRLID